MRNTGERPGKVVDASSTDTLIKTHGSGRRCGSVIACTYRRRRVSISQTQRSIHCPWNVIPRRCRPPALLHYPVVRLQAIAVSYNGNLCVVSLHCSSSLLISCFSPWRRWHVRACFFEVTENAGWKNENDGADVMGVNAWKVKKVNTDANVTKCNGYSGHKTTCRNTQLHSTPHTLLRLWWTSRLLWPNFISL